MAKRPGKHRPLEGRLTQRPARAHAPVKSKANLRSELQAATERFLREGGTVKDVASGVSAWEPGTRPPPSRPLFEEPRAERTPLPEVVATIEARREAMKNKRKPVRKTRAQRSRRRIIYDDFGEPLRHVWVDD
ncbi:MAG: hypothetical protein AAGG55_04010 [Pseudomonadota bacterium]